MKAIVLAGVLTVAGSVVTACIQDEARAPAGIFFPTLTRSQDEWPAALISGSLAEEDGCVVLTPGEVLLIWPKGSTVERIDAGGLRITVDGKTVGETGDRVDLGGGYLGETRNDVSQAETMIGEPIPERCRVDGGYWLTAPPS